VRGSITGVDARFRDSVDPALEGKRLPQVPRGSGSLSTDLLLPRDVAVSFVWQSLGAQFDDDRNTFRLAPANRIDLRVGGRLRAFDWYVVLENAADSRIEVGRTPLVTLAPGRAVRAGAGWRW
jgi:hypothetical protein